MKLTLDWNCVIEVEEKQPQAAYVIDLINRHRKGQFEVALLAASASENMNSKRLPGNAEIFLKRVLALGWQDLPLVPMPAISDLSYWDNCYYVDDGDKFERDFDALWLVIAPNTPRKASEHLPLGMEMTGGAIQSEALSKWRNKWCDVISAYSHIKEGRDIFVTNNTRDFQRNFEKLSELGMKHICIPAETNATVVKIRSAQN